MSTMRQLLLDLLPETPPSLENYVAGGNGESFTALAAWLSPEAREPAFFLWGEPGSGKTHLLQAASSHLGGMYCDGREDPDLQASPSDGDFLAVDNLEALTDSGQITLFNHFNRLRAQALSGGCGRLLVATDAPPAQLTLREDLRTRLGSALIYRLAPLTDGEKLAALQVQASRRGMKIPADALSYLLARAPRDMRSLSALLTALDLYSLEKKRPISMTLLREVLNQETWS